MAIETILLAVGPMDTARADDLAETALELAEPLDATVVIGHAFTTEEYEDFRENLGFEARAEDVDPDEVAARRPPVGDLQSRLEEAGVDTAIRGKRGDVDEAVVELARDVDADRLILAGQRGSPAQRAVLGSVSKEIILSAPCSVTYFRDLDVME
ncbi:universal stress protein [Natrialbaceae archaeon AArc-T1-2]|uniref:universal stress protein n=1 Tax=Natrialbaceae archaeon AArc-T1-2 TaxID=3053904 RepID=UPI00255B1442|nr:universal stress protein [Natrialbaceae archaeon AArc-T1-2]WIV68040.1 universal stress protein [Natrialbaceae archaeon AArc-T1-2]